MSETKRRKYTHTVVQSEARVGGVERGQDDPPDCSGARCASGANWLVEKRKLGSKRSNCLQASAA